LHNFGIKVVALLNKPSVFELLEQMIDHLLVLALQQSQITKTNNSKAFQKNVTEKL
jgi:hypothetical protein